MSSLTVLSDDYSSNRISAEEYRAQRKFLLNLIDQELNGVQIKSQDNMVEVTQNDTLIDKALSFLKLDKLKETN